MAVLIAVASLIIIVTVLTDAFEAIVLPRRVTRRIRLTSMFYRTTWRPWSAIARRISSRKRRETFLSFYGPLSLLLLLVVWAFGLVIGFALLQYAFISPMNIPAANTNFGTYLYMSGVTFFTLGFGDVAPVAPLGRTLAVLEAGTGFGFLAIVIGYLPVLYQAFSRREVNISLLDARAGTPPTVAELLLRHGRSRNIEAFDDLLRDWERWAAELMESHLSYPVLCYFRSMHDNQSWLSSLTTILDACALVTVGINGAPAWQAQLTFAMARHAVVDIAQIFNTSPRTCTFERLPANDFARLRTALASVDLTLRDGDDANQRLAELRRMYEPYVNALAEHLMMPLPPWINLKEVVDNWQTSAWERNPKAVASTFAQVCKRDDSWQDYFD